MLGSKRDRRSFPQPRRSRQVDDYLTFASCDLLTLDRTIDPLEEVSGLPVDKLSANCSTTLTRLVQARL
jgi:hypothetical protein